jgi:hypothetical protein
VKHANILKTNNMSKCPNCGAAMSCGCQKRVSPNGKVGCSKCINQLNNLIQPQTQKKV